ncbi:MAG: hybrid sensor histidine kinase/response regulator [Epsilonproteobacteria bacterium]|nr:hybrid sensor histidine kinase/response regulator [Campylobacterota bacterium]OIO14600.1 MAG: chemotaxis protein CheA [Helicobacteraceae bacterium CG1_02_36_14]PIP09555.1 MAG: chemotaxis protein CheA [Sulfurimonas sp. CG23_combo_of_CG06-09_8_20_14_all_36_33]PIS25284.1 MAG: hybrid sensor histidine kinase/response regulator [Sulfurimonas sp. CG08_land_8_20_14_0_20_36_33]PIU33542.1 MAG: hybrid sensor histidine kinase/response regulator [Sulfurimonas sp. CG07_land_8_20_14_0_80_36_56]PIV04011.1 
MDEFQEILQDFLVESFELIEQLDQDLVELESRPEDLELLNGIFRVAHTVKGASSFLNFDVLTHLTHHMEDVLNKARHGDLVIDANIMDVILESIDLMKTLLHLIRDTSSDAGVDVSACVSRLDKVSGGTGEVESPVATPAVEEPKAEETPAETAEEELDYDNMSDADVEAEIERLLAERQEQDKAKRAAKIAAGESVPEAPPAPMEENSAKPEQESAPAPVPKPAPVPVAPKAAPAKEKSDDTVAAAPATRTPAVVEQTIRVDVKRLDHLMNLIGELVLAKNRLIKINDDVEERYEGEEFLEELNQVVSIVSLVTTDLQIAVMKTRMLPVGKVFNKFPRMIRDLTRELNKKMELEISGEETELDKSIVEEIGDPLVHIIRNSCDHGIEMPDVRLAAGKPEVGTISLKAYNEGNAIVIQIDDDGKGLDAEMLKAKSLEKGVITEKEAEIMSEKEAFALIFKPGFSTAASVTSVSGRGVGMDVVKTNIEKLNGIIDIESTIGKGTSLKLKIPLTLAIIQALLVGVQEEHYAIPLASVLETVRISKDEIFSVENRSVLRLRNEVLSLVHIGDIFEVERILDSSEHAYVVVLGLGSSKIGLIVDSLIGQEEIVIKSLGDYLTGVEGIAGATIRGDGGVTLIVDVAALMTMAKGVKVPAMMEESSSATKEKTKASDYTVMIVDDSKTDRTIMRKALEPIGITLVEAADGQEALNILKQGDHTFDAMLVDIEMPRMDGYTLATEIKKYNRYKNLPLIAVTSRTGKSDRMRGVESGMVEYITKPYSADYLLSVVQRNVNFKSEFL